MALDHRLDALIAPVVEDFDLEYVGCRYFAQGKHSILRVFIDKAGGIGVEDCAQLSRQLGALLDVEDAISGAYSLEVSSPGIDRPLFKPNQFEAVMNKRIKIKLKQSARRQSVTGRLQAVESDGVVIFCEAEQASLNVSFVDMTLADCLYDSE